MGIEMKSDMAWVSKMTFDNTSDMISDITLDMTLDITLYISPGMRACVTHRI